MKILSPKNQTHLRALASQRAWLITWKVSTSCHASAEGPVPCTSDPEELWTSDACFTSVLSLLAELNFTSPTRIQQQAIPRLLVRPFSLTHALKHPSNSDIAWEILISWPPCST